jgi:hypothetical protein
VFISISLVIEDELFELQVPVPLNITFVVPVILLIFPCVNPPLTYKIFPFNIVANPATLGNVTKPLIVQLSAKVNVEDVEGVVRFPVHVFPLLVIVEVAEIVNVPVDVIVIPASKVTFPATVKVALPANVPVKPVQSIDVQIEPVLIVKVFAPEAAVRKTVSPAIGKEKPLAPPSVSLQLVVLFQLPVPPPTKYLAAIVKLF